ncbi:winged helix-turn-helix domain-containing protein [Streptomyces sp. NPDC049887]|uniref:winged helix-turn-helix domain-containing protein n=1 Tax=Streptomyces sp. NPDC049887 TaxID=3155654 RepID=UPI0034271DF2
MRDPEGGGLTAERRAFREKIRLQAGARFAAGEKTAVIAKDLRVSVRSVERWRRAWREGGMEALRSAGPANSPTVTDAQFAVLEEELGEGPVAHGFEDERWTLARVQTVIRRRFRLTLSVATVWRLLKRHGWSWQAPARRALGRDEHAKGGGRAERVENVNGPAGGRGRFVGPTQCASQSVRRRWGRGGSLPVRSARLSAARARLCAALSGLQGPARGRVRDQPPQAGPGGRHPL